NTFSQMWGISAPQEAQEIIQQQVAREGIVEPKNLEEQALSLVGRDIFERLVKAYTSKQWGKPCSQLPASIIKRLPCRFTYDNNYFNDRYQGIPEQGYTALVKAMLDGTEVMLDTDYKELNNSKDIAFDKVIYCGPIDEFFDFNLGALEYRSLRFSHEAKDVPNYQGVAVQNFTDKSVLFTRIIEHKHFVFGTQPTTIITKEYPAEWSVGDEPYYPINDEKNEALYQEYVKQAQRLSHIVFAGRLGGYKYYDMDKAIEAALTLAHRELHTSTAL
ncbi:MAG: UDP-galactopyranose mutase, partial [Eggerthellaceae bacterium]|nr:UDP-galactopyranose mutase [Eggerthellaceae bacterium]